MALREDDDSKKKADLYCEKCGRMCEPQEIQVCPSCRRKVCTFCTYRVGGRDYCSRGCGDVFFFGGDIDEDEEFPDE